MNDKELRKRLLPLASSRVPTGYWEGYWARLRPKVEAAQRRVVDPMPARRSMPWIPVLASAAVGFAAYVVGVRHATPPVRPVADTSVRLASLETEREAQKVFKEMLNLFPSRVNWISFVDGKVDFSISSVAYEKQQTLMPLVVQMRHPGEEFEARFLVRQSQEAAARVPWDKETTLELKVSRRTADGRVLVSARLSGQGSVASVEGDAKLGENQGTVIGVLRWRREMIPVQLTRGAEAKSSPIKSHEKADSIRL